MCARVAIVCGGLPGYPTSFPPLPQVTLGAVTSYYDAAQHPDVRARTITAEAAAAQLTATFAWVLAGEPAAPPIVVHQREAAAAAAAASEAAAGAGGGGGTSGAPSPTTVLSPSTFKRAWELIAAGCDLDVAFVGYLISAFHLYDALHVVPPDTLPPSIRNDILTAAYHHHGLTRPGLSAGVKSPRRVPGSPPSSPGRTAPAAAAASSSGLGFRTVSPSRPQRNVLTSLGASLAATSRSGATTIRSISTGGAGTTAGDMPVRPSSPRGAAGVALGGVAVRHETLDVPVSHILVLATHTDGHKSLQRVAMDRFLRRDDKADLLERLAVAGVDDVTDVSVDF